VEQSERVNRLLFSDNLGWLRETPSNQIRFWSEDLESVGGALEHLYARCFGRLTRVLHPPKANNLGNGFGLWSSNIESVANVRVWLTCPHGLDSR
jgi:hypothetical protein